MAYSTELREPFLDFRLVEFAFAQPYEYKIKNGIQKYLLREVVSEYLDDSITNSPKRPLQTPQREWLGNELSDYVESKIENLKDNDFSSWFDVNEISNEWQKYKDGDNDSSFHIPSGPFKPMFTHLDTCYGFFLGSTTSLMVVCFGYVIH